MGELPTTREACAEGVEMRDMRHKIGRRKAGSFFMWFEFFLTQTPLPDALPQEPHEHP